MRRNRNGKMRLLSLLLGLVLAVGLLQVGVVEVRAYPGEIYSFTHAYDCQRSPAFPKKGETFQAFSFRTPLNASGSHIGGDKQATYDWKLTSLGSYSGITSPSSNLTAVVDKVADQYGVSAADTEVFQLTKDGSYICMGAIFAQSAELTVFLGDNWDANGSTYLLSNTTLSDPTTVTISRDATTGFVPQAPGAPQHTHVWVPATSGNGTKEASTTVTCSGCSETLTVSLTASDVTLPGEVFNAKISTQAGAPRAANLPLTVSQTPGYKYSAAGSNFTPVDPATFAPKQGIYQASILIMEGNLTVENLYVTYTVTDPVVTASTGDDRPIEIMVMGMVLFCAMAAAAFALDGKRKSHR